MKRLFAILLTLSLIFCLAGCAPGGYLHSTEGDLTVTLPEPEPEKPIELNDSGRALIGEWELISLVQNGVDSPINGGTYVFSEYGILDIAIGYTDGTVRSEKYPFSCVGEDIYISGDRVILTFEEDMLTITSNSEVHLLQKIVQEPAEPQE